LTDPNDAIGALAAYPTPTISNALECLGVDPDGDFSDATVSMLTHGARRFVGYAITTQIRSRPVAADEPASIAVERWWGYVATSRSPGIVVAEDLDPEPHGAMWGEVMGRVHRSLGVVGIVTNGAARDIDELSELGFPIIAGRPAVSHAHARFLAMDSVVRVAGLTVAPGDLLHADRHGVQRIPATVDLEELRAAAQTIEDLERELFAAADEPGSTIDSFLRTWTSVRARWPSAASGSESDSI
jgi:regulator of RNase E activity RraA